METVVSTRYSLKQIFQEHWEDYLFENKDSLPDYIISTVEKMLACRDPEKLGYHKYSCPHHSDTYIIIPHSCKCRLCTSCGKILTDHWVAKTESQFPPVSFHHICFTIPDSLRELFDKCWSLYQKASYR